jgi:hypothetical protein
MITKVISGAQVGASIAGLVAARSLNVPTGGTVTRRCMTIEGTKPFLIPLYGLTEIQTSSYLARTAANIRDSDATLRFAIYFGSRGELCTLRYIHMHNRPFSDFAIIGGKVPRLSENRGEDPTGLVYYLRNNNVRTLNIAGNANRAIEPLVQAYVTRMLEIDARLDSEQKQHQ